MSLSRVLDPSRRLLLGSLGVSAFMLLLGMVDGWTRGTLRLPALVPPFGASVAIVFLVPESPAARPWNVVMGQTASAFMACAVLSLVPQAPVSVQAALAVCGAGLIMLATNSFHPPGGATALLTIVAEKKLGFVMLLCPVLIGSLVLVGTRYAFDLAIQYWALRTTSSSHEGSSAARSAPGFSAHQHEAGD